MSNGSKDSGKNNRSIFGSTVKKHVSKKQKILEIIDDVPNRERADSQDFKEIEKLLQQSKLEFLQEYFSSDKSTMTLKELREMKEDKLEELLGGQLYAKRLREELNKSEYQ